MTKSKKILTGFLFVILISLSVVSFFAYSTIEKLNNSELSSKTATYELKKGATVKTVINDLLDNSWDRLVARFYLRFSTPYSSIQKGEYLIGPNKSFISILKDMSEGNVIVKTYPTFTIVEGMNLSKIIKKAERFKNKLSDDRFFSAVAKEDSFIKDLLKDHEELLSFIGDDVASLEGLISPATYPLYEKDPFYSIFRQGIVTQIKSLKAEWDSRDESNNIKTPYEALILASLIERETFLDEERNLIAAVFENRLSKGMRLQTDPAVMYGVSKDFSGTLTRSHLKADSPYNTYTRDGLPPTPICMPQTKSIHAALHPDKSKALYFVAKGISPTEGHVFSGTLTEHNKAVAEYRKKVRNYKMYDEKNSEQNENANSSDADKDNSPESAADSLKNESSEKSEKATNPDTSKMNEAKDTTESQSSKEVNEPKNSKNTKSSVNTDKAGDAKSSKVANNSKSEISSNKPGNSEKDKVVDTNKNKESKSENVSNGKQ
jgi:UPF0755 protein